VQHIPGRNTPRRRRRYRRSSKRSTLAAILLGSLAAITPIVIATLPAWGTTSARVQTLPRNEPVPTAATAAVAKDTTPARRNYRYSVIPGGARTRDELLNVVSNDAVVASHYYPLSRERVREERLTEEQRAYVSYRIGDRVYWTKERVTLPAGEPILTDGVIQIRARCGNRIAYEPQLPTSDEQPDLFELDALAPPASDTVALLATLPLSAMRLSVTPGLIPSGQPVPSGMLPLVPSPTDRFGGWHPPTGLPGLPIEPTGNPVPNEPVPNLVPPIPVPEQRGPDQPGPLTPPTPDGKEPVRDYWPETTPKQPVSVPEPSTVVLLGAGAAGMMWRRVRSHRSR
jgi:hypothetical protein